MDFQPSQAARPQNFELLMDVPLRVSARLGSCRLSVAELLALSAGSLVELDRPATDPIDLFVNDKLVARGEIVAVGEHFGVCITDVLSGASE